MNLISLPQTAYVKNRFVGGSGTLISKITEISDWFNIKGFLVTMIIEKIFDSPDNDFFSSVLIKFGFGKNFYDMSRHFTKNQLLCVINGRATTQYLNLAVVKMTQSLHVPFLVMLDILFLLIKKYHEIEGTEMFERYSFILLM